MAYNKLIDLTLLNNFLTKIKGIFVSTITYDSTNKKITKTINGTTSDVVTTATLKSAMDLSKSDVELENVDNVKQYSASNPPPYPVTSVNGNTGAVTVSVPSAATASPEMDGTAAVGTSTKYAKEDHVHPVDTSRAAANHTHSTQGLHRPNGLRGLNDVTLQPLINTTRANRLAFLPADQIIIEKTIDGGTTWTDAGISNSTKLALFSEIRPSGITLPLLNGVRNVLCGLRITITAMKYNVPEGTAETQKYNYWSSTYVNKQERYCQLKEFYFWVSTSNDSMSVKVERATGANPNNWQTCFEDASYYMVGWSGCDYIKLTEQSTFGGNTNQTGQPWNYRLTFMTKGKDGTNIMNTGFETQQQSLMEIRGYGDTWWGKSNEYMANDKIYTHDANQNVTFPAKITATSLQATQLNGVTIGSSPKFTDTTYESKAAASGGTDVSLVTTGEKAIWNAKTSNTGTITGIQMNGASKGTSGVVDLGTVITEHQSLAAYRTATNQDTIDNEQNTRISNLESIKTPTTINSTPLATFNTTISNMPFKELTITIEPAQSGSGDPSPINIRTITNQTGCDLIVSSTTNAQDGTTYSITFPTSIGTFYGGTVDIVNKKLTVLYVLTTVNNFSNNWTYSSSTKQFYASNPALKRAAAVRTTKIYSDKYKCLYNGEPFDANYTNVIYSLNANLYIQGTEYNNVEDFLTNAGDTQICFPLTSPEEYNLSDIPEVVTLLGENNIWASYGNVTVTYGAYLEAINKHVECVEDSILNTITPLENRLTALEGNHQKYYAKISLSYTGATARTRIMLPYDTVAGVYRIDTICNVSAGAAVPISVSDNSTAKSIAANGYAYLKMPVGDPSSSAGKQIIFVVYPGSANSGTIDITIERSNITDDITNIDIDYS